MIYLIVDNTKMVLAGLVDGQDGQESLKILHL